MRGGGRVAHTHTQTVYQCAGGQEAVYCYQLACLSAGQPNFELMVQLIGTTPGVELWASHTHTHRQAWESRHRSHLTLDPRSVSKAKAQGQGCGFARHLGGTSSDRTGAPS